MCTPLALGIAGGVVSGIGSFQQKQTDAMNYTMQANGLQRDINAEKEASAFEIASTRREVSKTLGSARAGYAANGLALSGSAAEVIDQSAIQGELDLETIRWNSKVKQDNLSYQQAGARANAKASKAAAPIAFFGSVFSGAAGAM